MKIVIIGASAAGISAAIKASEPDTEVVIIAKEDSVHSRCMLHKFLVISGMPKGSVLLLTTSFRQMGLPGSITPP